MIKTTIRHNRRGYGVRVIKELEFNSNHFNIIENIKNLPTQLPHKISCVHTNPYPGTPVNNMRHSYTFRTFWMPPLSTIYNAQYHHSQTYISHYPRLWSFHLSAHAE